MERDSFGTLTWKLSITEERANALEIVTSLKAIKTILKEN